MSRRLRGLWTNLSLPALLLNRHLGIDLPVEPFALLVALDKGIVLPKVMPHAGLPTACRRLELIPRILALDIAVDLLEVHLACLS